MTIYEHIKWPDDHIWTYYMALGGLVGSAITTLDNKARRPLSLPVCAGLGSGLGVGLVRLSLGLALGCRLMVRARATVRGL